MRTALDNRLQVLTNTILQGYRLNPCSHVPAGLPRDKNRNPSKVQPAHTKYCSRALQA